MAQESLPSNVVSSAQVLANVGNFLNIRDTELNSFLVAVGDGSLRKTRVEEKRAKAQKESNVLLGYTRKAIQRLTYLKKFYIIPTQLKDDVVPCESQFENWKTNLQVMAAKEEQYIHQYKKYEACEMRNAGAVVHSYGMESCLVTMLNPQTRAFRITHMEMIKRIQGHRYYDKLVIPIIENTT